ncbi:MAG: PD-(D/E)XK nuclease domain-containing protein [Fibrobacter sp.]|nr:PD-(D/E)XK nuclease domain-containing protein [Fibrobacter sp.]
MKFSKGSSDAVVETADAVYMFEFKLNKNGTADDALKQIDDKGYLIPYTANQALDGMPKRLFKIGVSFDAERRTLGQWKVAEG